MVPVRDMTDMTIVTVDDMLSCNLRT
jgi:hypothetical protein